MKRGIFAHVQRGVYAVVPLEADPATFQPDPILVTLRTLGPEYAFSHFSALVLHGAEHQVHETVHVTKPHVRSRKLRVGATRVHVHTTESLLWETATMMLRRGRDKLLVTTPERTLVDLVGLPAAKQDYAEVVEAFRSLLPRVNPSELARATELWGNRTTHARMGHLVARHAQERSTEFEDAFKVSRSNLAPLQSPVYFGTRPNDPANRFDRAFNLVYPETA